MGWNEVVTVVLIVVMMVALRLAVRWFRTLD